MPHGTGGLNQLYAMRYGTVPIAHGTGGLKDTVIDVVTAPEGTATGWTYKTCDAGVGPVRVSRLMILGWMHFFCPLAASFAWYCLPFAVWPQRMKLHPPDGPARCVMQGWCCHAFPVAKGRKEWKKGSCCKVGFGVCPLTTSFFGVCCPL
eukprot:1160413-Pelagomonas_calceolata.AAC.4